MNQPPVIRAAFVNRSPADAWAVFTEQIGAWWPLPTHGMFGDRAGSVVFRDGKLVEQSVDGSEATWAEVLRWDPPTRLALAWHPGRDVEEASAVHVSFEPDGSGTRVVIEHRGWETFGDDAMNRRLGYVGPNAWGYVLDHYGDVAELRPPGPDRLDTAPLRIAYDNFYAEADRGGFGDPEPGEWNAEQVVTHVALNDAAMLAVCQAIVHGNPTRFENEVCQDRNVLTRAIAAGGELPMLIERGRAMADLVVCALHRLDAEQRQTLVPCLLQHDGQVMVDAELPWQTVAVDTQATRHLPAHVEQLRNLRM